MPLPDTGSSVLFPGVLNLFTTMLLSLMLVVVFAGTALAQGGAEGRSVTDLRLAHLTHDCRRDAPVTFGQPFRPGDVPAGTTVQVFGDGKPIPTQVDVKARNADGSVRHAVISLNVPCDIDRNDRLTIVTASASSQSTSGSLSLEDLASSGFDARIELSQQGRQWALSAHDLLQRVVRDGGCHATTVYCRRWLAGPVANEWIVGAPPVGASGQVQPQLMVFFAIRAYGQGAVRSARVDTVVENDWAYADAPQNIDYSATLQIPGRSPVQIGHLGHYAHARWHQVAWYGDHSAEPWFAALSGPYLQATPAVPRYEDVQLDSQMLSQVRQSCAPMDHCDVMDHMEATGAQAQIGPLPQWSSAYVVNPHDYRTYRWMLADSDALGAYSIHFRERDTGNPLSLDRHPCATLIGPAEQSQCQAAPHGDDRFPRCVNCDTPLEAESAHHGAPAYVAYLVTGDWYYEQELTFWADWVEFFQNPEYRDYQHGLVQRQQIRGQAWSLRTIGDAAYLLPDDSPHKAFFNSAVANNIRWYTSHDVNGGDANPLGILTRGDAITYPLSGSNRHTAIATWQMSFFNWAVGNLADQGFAGADRLRDYFSRFQIGSLNSPGFCPLMASAYTLQVRDQEQAPLYQDFDTVYRKTFPGLASLSCGSAAFQRALQKDPSFDGFPYPRGTMVGYPASDTGFVANYQIGMASAASSDRPGARDAWSWFVQRPVRPDYTHAPQFAVVPTH
ncbi:hypothetical protein C41B8_07507 [Salinisphaera hydrothermalis C41B8]|uniref:Uncharacterized protein n=2 Tax=Salinisphaera TaxID=180541 RepID=A0A084IME1_SALHC|nr:hypothetical protein C41B8_07507 [Salinisphaera hydrothermalis C41B8]